MQFLRREARWWSLFMLVPLMVVLMLLDDDAPLTQAMRMILLGLIMVIICGLAWRWVERHHNLVEREGADAWIAYRPLYDTLNEEPQKLFVPEPEHGQRRVTLPGGDPARPS